MPIFGINVKPYYWQWDSEEKSFYMSIQITNTSDSNDLWFINSNILYLPRLNIQYVRSVKYTNFDWHYVCYG